MITKAIKHITIGQTKRFYTSLWGIQCLQTL